MTYIRNIVLIKSKYKACLEIFIDSDEKWVCNYLLVRNKNKEQIEVTEEYTGIDFTEILKKTIKNKYPLCIIINGKGVVSRKIQVLNEDTTEESIIQNVLPNAKQGDFYLRKYPSTGNNIFVSLIRKSLLEDVLASLRKNKISLVEVFWGPFPISSVIPLIGVKQGEIKTTNYKFIIEDSNIIDYLTIEYDLSTQDKLHIGEERLEMQSLTTLGTLIQYFFTNKAENTSKIKTVLDAESNFIYSKLFAKTGQYSLILTFIVLLINFILFDYYNRKQQDLSAKVANFSDLLLNQDTLKKTLDSKMELLGKSGLLESSKISFYSDRIASVINEGITLTKLEVNPVKELTGQSEEETGYTFTNGIIEIIGAAKNSTYLNEWIKDLKVYKWVKDITIKNYNRDNSLKPASFTILAKIDSL